MYKSKLIKNAILKLDIDKVEKYKLINYFDGLVLDNIFLDCLCDQGLENWEGYQKALDMMGNDDEEEEVRTL